MKYLRIFLSLLLLMEMHSLCADITIVDIKKSRLLNKVTQQRVMDDAGNFCALFRLKTDIKDILVDASQARPNPNRDYVQTLYLVEPQCESHPDEVWIYLSPQTKRFRLYHPDYGGMNEESSNVSFGYYYLQDKIVSELIYSIEIKCEKPTTKVAIITPNLHTLVEAKFSTDNDANNLYFDGSRVRSGKTYLVPTGNHVFKARRYFYKSEKQRVEVRQNQPIHLSASISRIPSYIFGGFELGKPTSYSDLAYGFRAGVVCRWGVYVSYLTTIGNDANGEAVAHQLLPFEPILPYSDPHCQFKNFNAGLIYNFYSGWHVYAGVGQASRSVNWKGTDGKRHETKSDYFSGRSWEAGLLYNANKFFLSAGADHVDGNFGGRVGIGLFLNVFK